MVERTPFVESRHYPRQPSRSRGMIGKGRGTQLQHHSAAEQVPPPLAP